MIAGHGLLLGTVSVWLTPLWLISVGAACGLAVLAIAYGCGGVGRAATRRFYSNVAVGGNSASPHRVGNFPSAPLHCWPPRSFPTANCWRR